MHTWRHHIHHYRAVNWLLVMMVLCLAILPVCLHIHHSDGEITAAHTHTIDLHIGIDNVHSTHSHDIGTIELAPDVLVKKLADNPLVLLLVTFLVIGLFHPGNPIRRSLQQDEIPPETWRHHSPPLRAPPQS